MPSAVGAGVPIYEAEEVLRKENSIELGKNMKEDQLKRFLEDLGPEDFRYKP